MHFKQIVEDLIACVWLLISLYVLFTLLFTLDTFALIISELCLQMRKQKKKKNMQQVVKEDPRYTGLVQLRRLQQTIVQKQDAAFIIQTQKVGAI